MPQTLGEFDPLLQPVEDFCLFANRAAGAHGVVPRDARKAERDGEFNAVQTRFPSHHDNQRGHECRVRAGHSTRAEKPALERSFFKPFRKNLRDFAQKHHDERNQKRIEAEEGHAM